MHHLPNKRLLHKQAQSVPVSLCHIVNYTFPNPADQPECVTCQCPLTVKHILIECTDFRDNRNKYFVPSTMKDVFEQVSMRNVINFIK